MYVTTTRGRGAGALRLFYARGKAVLACGVAGDAERPVRRVWHDPRGTLRVTRYTAL
ncbi:MAG: hypothetical protein KTR15_13710 [Phycisphaeraceae bacterium]|nr:hypothetical protein [Phycisphaeraceae bacterium]